MKLISVIIPAYNVEKYIENCLISVFEQSYKNIEVIIVDDFSTDQTVKIAKSFQKKFNNLKIFSLKNFGYKKNSGISIARNLGIKFAKGYFIALLDADDLWDKDKLKLQAKFIKNNILCYTDIKFKYEKSRDFLQTAGRYVVNFLKKINSNSLSFFNNIAPSSVLIKKKIFKKIKFGTDFESYGIEDIDMWLRIQREYPNSFFFLKKKLTIILYRNDSVSSSYIVQYVRAIQLYAKNFIITRNFYDFNNFLLGIIIRFIFLFLKNNYQKIKKVLLIFLSIITIFYVAVFHSPIFYYINQNLLYSNIIKKSEAIVILSGSGSVEYFNKTYLLRYQEALELSNQGFADRILIYGREFIIPESVIIKSLLINSGIDSNRIYLINENNPEFKNTYELITGTNKLLLSNNIKKIILISSPEQTLRLKLLWNKINPKIEVIFFASKSFYKNDKYNHNLDKILIISRELLTLVFYKLFYKI
jgi:teichuronic acid biosynthesis glycosyltransferase TuaG